MYYKAINSGNADTLSIWETWNGAAWVAAGSLPTTTDDVYTNGFIVTVTTSQSYSSWNRSSVAAPLSITQGGQFQIGGANEITIQGTVNGTNIHLVGGTGASCIYRLITHSAKLFLIGDIYTGNYTSTFGFYNTSTYDLDIIGNQTANGTTAYAIYINGNAKIKIVGNQYAGGNTGAYAIYNNASVDIEIIGNQIASTAPAIWNTVIGSTIKVLGNSYASAISSAIYTSQDTAQIIVEGNLYNNLGIMAIRCMRLFLNVTPTTVWEFSDFDGNSQYLYGAGVNTGHPIEADVRKDTVYGPNDEFEGTLVQPPFAIADFIAALKADDLGKRLGKCATTEEVDSTVASYNT